MKKFQFLLYIFCLFISCDSKGLIDNKPFIDKIDNYNFSKTIFEVSIDNNGNITDTTSIEKIKTNEDNDIIFKEKTSWQDTKKTIKQTYYRNKDLFHQKTHYQLTDFEFETEYETFVNSDNIIDRAHMISKEPNKIDTIFMKYNYKYDVNSKKVSLSISASVDSTNSYTLIQYNESERIENKYQINDNDTTEVSKMNYRNGKITELIHKKTNPYMLNIYTYNVDENVKSRKIYRKVDDNLKLTLEYFYEYNEAGDLELMTINDIENDNILKRKLIISTSSQF